MSNDIVDFEDHCWRDIVSQETLEIYAPYRRETVVKGKPGLLAIDLFNCSFPDRRRSLPDSVTINPRSCGPYAWDAKPVLHDLFRLARAGGFPIFYSTAALPGDDGQTGDRATFRSPAEDSDAARDTAIHPEFAPHSGDAVVRKRRASAFFDTALAELLASAGVETLLVCGESTSGCVRATTVDGYSHGFHVVVVEDAVFDRSPLSHAMSLFDLHHKYADVMALSELKGKLPR